MVDRASCPRPPEYPLSITPTETNKKHSLQGARRDTNLTKIEEETKKNDNHRGIPPMKDRPMLLGNNGAAGSNRKDDAKEVTYATVTMTGKSSDSNCDLDESSKGTMMKASRCERKPDDNAAATTKCPTHGQHSGPRPTTENIQSIGRVQINANSGKPYMDMKPTAVHNEIITNDPLTTIHTIKTDTTKDKRSTPIPHNLEPITNNPSEDIIPRLSRWFTDTLGPTQSHMTSYTFATTAVDAFQILSTSEADLQHRLLQHFQKSNTAWTLVQKSHSPHTIRQPSKHHNTPTTPAKQHKNFYAPLDDQAEEPTLPHCTSKPLTKKSMNTRSIHITGRRQQSAKECDTTQTANKKKENGMSPENHHPNETGNNERASSLPEDEPPQDSTKYQHLLHSKFPNMDKPRTTHFKCMENIKTASFYPTNAKVPHGHDATTWPPGRFDTLSSKRKANAFPSNSDNSNSDTMAVVRHESLKTTTTDPVEGKEYSQDTSAHRKFLPIVLSNRIPLEAETHTPMAMLYNTYQNPNHPDTITCHVYTPSHTEMQAEGYRTIPFSDSYNILTSHSVTSSNAATPFDEISATIESAASLDRQNCVAITLPGGLPDGCSIHNRPLTGSETKQAYPIFTSLPCDRCECTHKPHMDMSPYIEVNLTASSLSLPTIPATAGIKIRSDHDLHGIPLKCQGSPSKITSSCCQRTPESLPHNDKFSVHLSPTVTDHDLNVVITCTMQQVPSATNHHRHTTEWNQRIQPNKRKSFPFGKTTPGPKKQKHNFTEVFGTSIGAKEIVSTTFSTTMETPNTSVYCEQGRKSSQSQTMRTSLKTTDDCFHSLWIRHSVTSLSTKICSIQTIQNYPRAIASRGSGTSPDHTKGMDPLVTDHHKKIPYRIQEQHASGANDTLHEPPLSLPTPQITSKALDEDAIKTFLRFDDEDTPQEQNLPMPMEDAALNASDDDMTETISLEIKSSPRSDDNANAHESPTADKSNLSAIRKHDEPPRYSEHVTRPHIPTKHLSITTRLMSHTTAIHQREHS